ncbi:MAG: deoxyribose-phosphate aldolase [Legionella sp.]
MPMVTAEQLIQCIDLTLLDEQATEKELKQLKQDANHNQVAAICVYTQQLVEFHDLKDIQLATVINFPHGNEDLTASLTAIEQALLLKATELDYVLPYSLYLAGNQQKALNHCQMISELCKQHHVTLKIILETGVFTQIETIYEVSTQLIELGCDFLKTSTGKIPQGASLNAAFAILSAINDTQNICGLKVSGGIRTPKQALQYARLAELITQKTIDKHWFRIGASSLLQGLLNKNKFSNALYS